MRTYTLNKDGVKNKPLETLEDAIAAPKVLECPEKGLSCNVSEDGDVKLEVHFSGQPEVECSKEGAPIRESSHFQMKSKDGVHTMVIKVATSDDKGLYKCTASNKAGMAWKTFTVDFEGNEELPASDMSDMDRPSFVEDESVVPFEVTDEGIDKLEARVQGKSEPNVALENCEHVTITSKDNLHTLGIRNQTVDDKGTYTLTATNKAGVGTCAFNVEIEGSS